MDIYCVFWLITYFFVFLVFAPHYQKEIKDIKKNCFFCNLIHPQYLKKIGFPIAIFYIISFLIYDNEATVNAFFREYAFFKYLISWFLFYTFWMFIGGFGDNDEKGFFRTILKPYWIFTQGVIVVIGFFLISIIGSVIKGIFL